MAQQLHSKEALGIVNASQLEFTMTMLERSLTPGYRVIAMSYTPVRVYTHLLAP